MQTLRSNGNYLLLHQSWHREPVDLQDPIPDVDGVPNLRTNMHPSNPVGIKCLGDEARLGTKSVSLCPQSNTGHRATTVMQHIPFTTRLAWGVAALWWISEVINKLPQHGHNALNDPWFIYQPWVWSIYVVCQNQHAKWVLRPKPQCAKSMRETFAWSNASGEICKYASHGHFSIPWGQKKQHILRELQGGWLPMKFKWYVNQEMYSLWLKITFMVCVIMS